MRHRRRRCVCLTSWYRFHDERLLEGQSNASSLIVAEIGARELRSEAGAQAESQCAGGSNDRDHEAKQDGEGEAEGVTEFYQNVLCMLEFHSENEVMSEAGSCISEEDVVSPAHPKGKLPMEKVHDVLRRLRLRELPDVEVAMRLSQQVRDHLRDHCSTLVQIHAPRRRLIIVGDLHGHLNDLLHVLDAYGEPSQENWYLFNGDFVDRGHWGPEVLFMLFCLKLVYPDSVHLNRGNHESIICNSHYGFQCQVKKAYPGHDIELYSVVQEAFRQLPLCHVIGHKIFVVHGGLPLEPVTLQEIDEISRGPVPLPAKSKEECIFQAFLWSDPACESGPSHRGAGCRFDEAVTCRFLETNGLSCIVRSHECVQEGTKEDHSGRVLTIFSASNYNHVSEGNNACVILVDSDCKLTRGARWNEPHVKSSEWKSDCQAQECVIARLRSMHASLPDLCSPRERCLGELHRMIFLARPLLLEAFEAADVKHNGRLTSSRWAEVMAICLSTPTGFPWLQLCPDLCSLEDEEKVPYVGFLFRFDNPLSRWLSDQWSRAMLGEISMRLGDLAATHFDRLDTCKGRRGSLNGFLSYAELRPLVHELLPTSEREARRESMRVLALFRTMDKDRSGFVSRHEFVAALDAASSQVRCPRGHRLSTVLPRCWHGCLYTWECDGCGMQIPHKSSRRHCEECDYDLCSLCAGNRPVVQKQWDNIENAIFLLCQSNCDVRSLVPLVDINGDGYVEKTDFIDCLEALLQGDTEAAGAVWELAWEHRGQSSTWQNKMPVSYFEQCLAIIDQSQRS